MTTWDVFVKVEGWIKIGEVAAANYEDALKAGAYLEEGKGPVTWRARDVYDGVERADGPVDVSRRTTEDEQRSWE